MIKIVSIELIVIGKISTIDLDDEFWSRFGEKFVKNVYDFVMTETATRSTRIGPTEVHVFNNFGNAGQVGGTRTCILKEGDNGML